MVGYHTELMLNEVYPVTLDSNGAATIASVGPPSSWQKWEIDTIHTESDSDTDVTLKVFRGGSVIAGTYAGNMDTDNTKITLMPSEQLVFKYMYGTAGSSATLTVRGKRWLQGKLAY